MRLSTIRIQNFRRIEDAEIVLANSAFLIGQNNFGKSSVIRAIEFLLSDKHPELGDYLMESDGQTRREKIILTGYFSEIDPETARASGFKGRVVNGHYCYRKTYCLMQNKPEKECMEYPYALLPAFSGAKSAEALDKAGIPPERIKDVVNKDGKLKKNWERELLDLVADFKIMVEPTWVVNPGGIPGNVLSKLPRILHVASLTDEGDVSRAEKNTLIAEVLGILFEDLLSSSDITQTLKTGFKALEDEMRPDTEGSLISNLCNELNKIIGGVFPDCSIDIKPTLQDLAAVLKPKYEVTMSSNVATDVGRQGTGLLRTALFSMLRYHSQLREQKGLETRPLLVAFEEPELYLHPSAANLLRDTIYALGRTDQIVCTTHSPWMIDLSKDLQSLTKMLCMDNGNLTAVNYGLSNELENMQDDDRIRVKMLQIFDDELSRAFFADRTVVVEGDSEVVALRRTLDLLPSEARNKILSTTQILKARGKASIISLVKYLQAMSIAPIVVHDRDKGIEGAERFNKPIADAVGEPARIVVLEECLEHTLGFDPPQKDKPYSVYARVSTWSTWEEVPDAWKKIVSTVFGIENLPLGHDT